MHDSCADQATTDDREAVRARLIASGVLGNDAYVVIAGPANAYGHYVTTIEEYGVQRYEGASTLFGPREFSQLAKLINTSEGVSNEVLILFGLDTLDAYIEKYGSLVNYLAPGSTGTPPSDAPPVEQTSKAISLQVRCFSRVSLAHS